MSQYATYILISAVLMASGTAAAQERARRNLYGIHTLMDRRAPIPEGMNWTRHRVGEGGYAERMVGRDGDVRTGG